MDNHLIQNIANFYYIIVKGLLDASSSMVIGVVSTVVWAAAGAIYLLNQYLNWVGDSTDAAKSLKFFAKAHAKLFVVWFLVMGASPIFGTMASWAGTRVIEAANGPMVDATQKLFSQVLDTTISMVELEGAYANAMFEATPVLNKLSGYRLEDLSGMTDAQASATLANAVNNQEMAMRDLQAQLAAARKMATSDNPDRARLGNESVASIRERIDSTTATINDLKAKAKAQKPVPPPKEDGWFAKLTSIAQMGVQVFVGFVSSAISAPWLALCHLSATITLLPGILLGLWGSWKLIGAAVELFSYLFSFAAKVIVASMISVGFAPLSMISFLFPSTQQYGKNFCLWWAQAIVASISLGIVVQLGAYGVGAITDSVGGLSVELTRILLGGLSGTASTGMALTESIGAGTALLSVGYSMSFLTQLVKGSISASAGLVSGHFHA
ncbi:hypothetical protein [Geothrix sp. PMB-07]|uniref:hypothetical protein n=1 Tax=Geothrix sp. PMB-07 TaxID=3068640 RepID=UPI0027404A8E|nr:hypothetical protein [Geothrix sp. PMB-07]WLT30650.1 hypothetical protein Q9293_13090 [Geothrix sp. PMB-07]